MPNRFYDLPDELQAHIFRLSWRPSPEELTQKCEDRRYWRWFYADALVEGMGERDYVETVCVIEDPYYHEAFRLCDQRADKFPLSGRHCDAERWWGEGRVLQGEVWGGVPVVDWYTEEIF